MRKKLWIVFAIIIAILAACEFIMPKWGKKDCTVSGAAANCWERYVRYTATKEVAKKINEQTQRYQKKNQELLAEFESKLPAIGEAAFQTADNNVENFVKKSTKFTFCSKLIYRMLKDKCTRKETVSQLLNPLIQENFSQPLAEAQTAVQDELQNFMLKIQENDNQYRAGLAELTASEVFQKSDFAADRALVTQLNNLNSELTRFAAVKMAAAVSAGLELVFIRATLSSLRSIGMRITARMAASAGIAGAAAICDGPLPIGDAIGAVILVGGTAWTIYDVVKAAYKLPKELRISLHNMIADYRKNIQEEALKQARSLVERCNSSVVTLN